MDIFFFFSYSFFFFLKLQICVICTVFILKLSTMPQLLSTVGASQNLNPDAELCEVEALIQTCSFVAADGLLKKKVRMEGGWMHDGLSAREILISGTNGPRRSVLVLALCQSRWQTERCRWSCVPPAMCLASRFFIISTLCFILNPWYPNCQPC